MFLWLKKHFIPHEGNDFKPHFLRHESMVFFLLLIIVSELLFVVQVFVVFNKTNLLASVLPAVLTTITNEERKDNNAGPLEQNDLLQSAAQLKADDMAARGYFSHTNPDGKAPWYYLDLVGYNYSYAGENLAINFFDSKDVAEAWMKSPTHRANVVKKDFTQIGIGVASGVYEGKNTVFVAEFFGTPAEKVPAKISVKNSEPASASVAAAPSNPTSVEVLGEETTATPPGTETGTVVKESGLKSLKSLVQKVITSPRQYVAYEFGAIALLVILSLLLVIFIKAEIRHPAIMMRGAALMAVIILLLFVNMKGLNLKTDVGANDITANTISAASY